MTDVDKILDLLRAKSIKRIEKLDKKEVESTSLWGHIRDTLIRAIQLREFVKQNASSIKYNFDDEFFKNLIIACFLHDLGKINWRFQLELFSDEEKMYDKINKKYKFSDLNVLSDFFGNSKKIEIKDHEVISLIYSLIFLEDSEWDKKVRTAILLHHYNYFYAKRSQDICTLLDYYPHLEQYTQYLIENKELVQMLLKKLIDKLKDDPNIKKNGYVSKILTQLQPKMERLSDFYRGIKDGYKITKTMPLFEVDNENPDYSFFVFLGCLRRCDYSASGNVSIEEINKLKDFFYSGLDEKIKKKVKRQDMWQEKILNKHYKENLVLIAPTGSGKTEFALLWAKKTGKKLIYTLPLRVALNDLYERFGNEKEGYFKSDFLRILHSTSFIEYIKEEKIRKDLNIDEKQVTAELFSSPLTLTTPDQLFLTSLKYYGFDKVVSLYPISAIVIDEIQAYKPGMAALIIKTSEIIKKLSGNLLIITATFPPYFESYFCEDKGFGVIDLKKLDNTEKNQIKNYSLKRHKLVVIPNHLFEYENEKCKIKNESFERIKNIFEENKGKSFLVIVNNVGKAIELYKKLVEDSKTNGDESLYLLHSRVLEKEKSQRIDKIKKKLDEIKEKHKINEETFADKRLILVATQIVEASVDVDFDILITEASPIDSQIQRWGRIYRNRDKDYTNNEPNIFIFAGIDQGTSAIYDELTTKKTIDILKNYQGQILDYEKERKIINEVFESKIENKTLKEVFIDEIEKSLNFFKYYSAEKKAEAQRIFRRVAGIQAVVPKIMKKSEDEIEKVLGKIIEDKNNWDLSWDDIIYKVKEGLNKKDQKIDKWILLEKMYSNSFNLPVFSFENFFEISKTFKGFFVLNIKDEEIDDVVKYGVSRIKNISIDEKEIEEASNIA